MRPFYCRYLVSVFSQSIKHNLKARLSTAFREMSLRLTPDVLKGLGTARRLGMNDSDQNSLMPESQH